MLLRGDITFLYVHDCWTFTSIMLVIQYLGFLFLFQSARETGALQAAKNKLEKQVEDLTLRLQLEKRMRVNDCDFAEFLLVWQSLSILC